MENKEIKNGIEVPYCTGRNYPKFTVPDGACDCHHHIYDPEHFAYVPTDTRNQPPATVGCYRLLQEKLGTTRNVIVQPSAYGFDNRCTLAALREMGIENTRAIVVVPETISDEELQDMDQQGVRGIRINMNRGASDDLDPIRHLAERIAPMGWCICFWMSPQKAVELEQFLRDLPCEVVFDHRGHIPAKEGTQSEAFRVIAGMLRDNKAWVKLSGLYWDSERDDFADSIAVGRGYVEANPDRVIWGTDWPHPSHYSGHKEMPNDTDMLDALVPQAGSEENLRKILVTNPEKLFGFAPKTV